MGKIKTTNIFLLSILYSLIAHVIVVYGIIGIIQLTTEYFEITNSIVLFLVLIEVFIIVLIVSTLYKYKAKVTFSTAEQNWIIIVAALFFEITLADFFIYTETFSLFLYGIGLTKIFTIPLIFIVSNEIIKKISRKRISST